ncbi:response regulator [Roseovarius arcticus]|uniref:response regulator n=1 Tax=Roseovarius arcticus TaxID=2547404 RepID=UPI0011101D1A|nr:response regulator [Roseovarius arcticus]
MVVGYILVGSVAGLIASFVALLFGASFWLAFGLYVLIGSATLVLLPLTIMLVGHLANRGKDRAATGPRDQQGDAPLVNPSSDQTIGENQAPMRILAVDDEPFILELIPMISAKAGFSAVTPAASGEEALRLLAKGDAIFDCLLIDISMPGMDGIELCRRVRQMPQYRHTPIVMLTAMRDMQNMGDAYRAGATDYATKPFDIEELGTRLQLAQEAIHTRTAINTTRHANSNASRRDQIPKTNFELPQRLQVQGMGSLVDLTALSNYLTQLPRKDVVDVQMFGISIDEIEAVHARYSTEQLVTLLEDLASAANECFGADRTVMAYTKDAILLIATDSANLPTVSSIEFNIEGRLKSTISSYDIGEVSAIGVSVGGPARAQGEKADRAEITTGYVIALTENRALDKQGRRVAGLFSR